MRPELITSWKERIEKRTGHIFEVNFITIHYAYFVFVPLLSALVFWGSSTPFRGVNFTDALFLCVSAMTEAGLNTVNLSTLNSWQQVMLFFLILGGSAIWVSIYVIMVRLRRFERIFHKVIHDRREHRRSKGGRVFRRARPLADVDLENSEREEKRLGPTSSQDHDAEKAALKHRPDARANEEDGDTSSNEQTQASSSSVEARNGQLDGAQAKSSPDRNITFKSPQHSPRIRTSTEPAEEFPSLPRAGTASSRMSRHAVQLPEKTRRPFLSFTGVGASASSTVRHRAVSASGPRAGLTRSRTISSTANQSNTHDYFHSAAGYFGRNSQVYGLTIDERQELGGCEYSAILFLSFMVPFYFFIWQFLGALALGAWVNNNRPSTARENGINPWWAGSFLAISAFNNSGMSLLDANMVSSTA